MDSLIAVAIALSATMACPTTQYVDAAANPRTPAKIDLEVVKTHKCAERFKNSPCLQYIVLLDNGHRRLICGPKKNVVDKLFGP